MIAPARIMATLGMSVMLPLSTTVRNYRAIALTSGIDLSGPECDLHWELRSTTSSAYGYAFLAGVTFAL
jgi:hypothetical protein